MHKKLRIQRYALTMALSSLLIGCYNESATSVFNTIKDDVKASELINNIPADAFSRVIIRGISQAYEAEQDGQRLLFVPADAVIEKGADELKIYTILKVEQNSWKKLIQKVHPELDMDEPVEVPDNAIKNEQEVKRLINSLQPNKLLKSALCGKKDEPPIIIYEAKGSFSPKHIFVEEPALQIAIRYLGYKSNKHFKDATMVVVVQSEDWKALDEKVKARKHEIEVSKAGVKTALDREGKLSGDSAETSIAAFPAEAIGIDKSKLHNALIIPKSENDIQKSGVNISARAINMLAPARKGGYMSKDVYNRLFEPDAPKSFGEKTHKWGGKAVTGTRIVALTAAVIAIPFTGGFSSLAIPIAFLAPALVDDLLPTDLGISPRQLAEYSTGYLGANGSAEYESHSKFVDCIKAIQSDLKKGKPVIVFWTLTSKSAQYAAVVGATNEEFIVMQPDGFLYRLSHVDMKTLMKRRFWSYVGVVTTHKNYHLVRFQDTVKKKRFLNRLKFWKS